MKYLKYIALIPLVLIFSCEDVIPVELSDADPVFVVDAWIDNNADKQEIKLSWSKPYFDSTLVDGITDAEVFVTNSLDEVTQFTHSGNGIYINAGDKIDEEGMTYQLRINHEGKSYSATTVQGRVPEIDSIIQELRVG